MLASMRSLGCLVTVVWLALSGTSAVAQDGTAVPPPPVEATPPPPGATPPVAPQVMITIVPSTTPPPSVPATSAAWTPAGSAAPGMAYGGPPPEVRPRHRRHWELMGPGIGLFVGGWILTFVATSIWYGETTSCSSTGWFGYTCVHYGPTDLALGTSYIPLVGPWLMLGDDGLRGVDFLVPVLFGLIQTTGLVLIIVGASLPGEEVEPEPESFTLRMGAAPLPGGGILTANGTF